MLNIKFTDKKPDEAGWYIAQFSESIETVEIVLHQGQLYNVNGARTHYTRWHCKWSDRIEF